MRIGRGTRGGKKEKRWKGGVEERSRGGEEGRKRREHVEDVRKIGGEE